ncbi:hypothetical protein SK803_17180 [Lentzea sp. BCCO 10_0856]|uniref:Uncharacterized protein n=1 Tax=Lentzea miocenica TaxID=3095431 RepID=A0ABU4T1C8_9PSEU|nr:hypothetical protein [Lentzea sp. BCCO 10_0856]MDX8031961.1 hypothetical protein [Lentzea sp. BCCO 10_0856]
MAVARFQIYRSAARASVTWRLLSANNRGLGKAVAPYPTDSECAKAVAELRELVANGRALLTRDAQLWSWRLQLGGVDLAVSCRSYQRRLQAQYAFRSFVELAADAPVAGLEQ